MKCTMKRILAYKLPNGDLIKVDMVNLGFTKSIDAFQLSNGEIIEDEKEATERVEFLNAMARLRAITKPNNNDLIDKLAKAAEESINGIQECQEHFNECRERKEAEKAKEEKVSEFEKITDQLRADIKTNCSDIHNLEVNKETIWKWIKSFVEHFEEVDGRLEKLEKPKKKKRK